MMSEEISDFFSQSIVQSEIMDGTSIYNINKSVNEIDLGDLGDRVYDVSNDNPTPIIILEADEQQHEHQTQSTYLDFQNIQELNLKQKHMELKVLLCEWGQEALLDHFICKSI